MRSPHNLGKRLRRAEVGCGKRRWGRFCPPEAGREFSPAFQRGVRGLAQFVSPRAGWHAMNFALRRDPPQWNCGAIFGSRSATPSDRRLRRAVGVSRLTQHGDGARTAFFWGLASWLDPSHPPARRNRGLLARLPPDRAAALVLEFAFHCLCDRGGGEAFHDPQGEVESRGDAAGGNNIAVVDDSRVDDIDLGVA